MLTLLTNNSYIACAGGEDRGLVYQADAEAKLLDTIRSAAWEGVLHVMPYARTCKSCWRMASSVTAMCGAQGGRCAVPMSKLMSKHLRSGVCIYVW